MKWIKIVGSGLLGVIALCFVTLLIASSRPNANRMQVAVTIHQRPENVWPWLYEPDKLKRWVSWLVDVKAESGPPALGRRSVWVMQDRNNNNAPMEIASRVESVEPARKLEVDLSAKEGFTGNAAYVLTDLGNGQTRLESDAKYRFDNWFARLMTPVVLLAAEKKMKSDMDHLRALVESGG